MKRHTLFLQHGYSYIEILLVMAVSGILLGFITINLLNAHRQTAQNTSLTSLVTDIRNQQFKSMVGTTEGRATSDNYGIYMSPTSYTLFHGTSYSPSDPANLTVTLQNHLEITTTFQNAILVFSKGSGEIKNYNAPNNTITVWDTTNNTSKTLTINQYGTITQVQ